MSDEDDDYLEGEDYADDNDGHIEMDPEGGNWSRMMKLMEDDKSEASSDDVLNGWINSKSEAEVPPVEAVVPEPVVPVPQPVVKKSPSKTAAVPRKKPSRKRFAPEPPSATKTADQLAHEERLLEQLKLEMGVDSDEDLGESSEDEDFENWERQQGQVEKVRKVTPSSDVSTAPTPITIAPPQQTKQPVNIPSPRSAFTSSPKSPHSQQEGDVVTPVQRSPANNAQPAQKEAAAAPPAVTKLPLPPPATSSVPVPVSRPTAPTTKSPPRTATTPTTQPQPAPGTQPADGNILRPGKQNETAQIAAAIFPDEEEVDDIQMEVQRNRTTWIHSMLSYGSSGDTSINDTWARMASNGGLKMSLPKPKSGAAKAESSILKVLDAKDQTKIYPKRIEDVIEKAIDETPSNMTLPETQKFLRSALNDSNLHGGCDWFRIYPNKLHCMAKKGKLMEKFYTLKEQPSNAYWKEDKQGTSPPSDKSFVVGLSVYSQLSGELIRTHEVYSCSKLSLLHSILRCDLSAHLIKLQKENTDEVLPDPDSSMLLLANGVFYLRKTPTSIDLLTTVKDWNPTEGKHNPWAYCDERDIDEMTFGDLHLDIGGLILFRHHGRCDHFLRLQYLTAADPDSCLPRTVSTNLSPQYAFCYICNSPASFVCSYCPQLPSHCLLCGDCRSKVTDIRSTPIGLPAES